MLRGRQFTMKDSYSLDATWEGLDKSYDLHAEAYKNIYTRCGLKFFIVGASSGAMGGTGSQEFMVESNAGEDTVALCDSCGYAANVEVATSNIPAVQRNGISEPVKEIHTPNVKTIDELTAFLGIKPAQCAKSLVYIYNSNPVLIFVVGNDQLNESKLPPILPGEFRAAKPEELLALTGADAGSIGPIGLKTPMRIIADKRLQNANGMYSGANKNDHHVANIDFIRDVKVDGYFDLRTVEAGEPCPTCSTPLRIVTAIEVGHIFKLGTKYSDSMHAYFLDEQGSEKPIIMGSYGIGVERIIAAHIEQSNDADGIIWDKAIAPFQVHLIAVNTNSEEVKRTSEQLYQQLRKANIETLFDDRRDVTPGFKFKDADLLGMPIQVIVGERNLKNGKVECKVRRTGERSFINVERVSTVVETIAKWLNAGELPTAAQDSGN
jgi:prolyl-tRNA synthetase